MSEQPAMKPAESTTEPTSAAAIMFVFISGAYTNCTKGPTSAAIAEMTSTTALESEIVP